MSRKADFQSVEFSERAEILLFAGENVALKLNRYLLLRNLLLSKIPPARKITLTGNVCSKFRLRKQNIFFKMVDNSMPIQCPKSLLKQKCFHPSAADMQTEFCKQVSDLTKQFLVFNEAYCKAYFSFYYNLMECIQICESFP